MKAHCLLTILALADSVMLPIHFSTTSQKCGRKSLFKSVECTFNGIKVYTKVKLSPTYSPRNRHQVNLMVDTGSAETWLVTENTKFMDVNKSHVRSLNEVLDPSIDVLDYTPHVMDKTNITIEQGFMDGSTVKLAAYGNHQFDFPAYDGETIRVPMDIYFLEQYNTDGTDLTDQGLLALAMTREPDDLDNLFLYKFLQAYPTKYQPMMSFDINWNEGYEEASCFGMGESLPIGNNLLKPTIQLNTLSHQWAVPISYVQLEFFNEPPIIIQPNMDYSETDTAVYVNTTGIVNMTAVVDIGFTQLTFSEYLFERMTPQQQMRLRQGYGFPCGEHQQVLPTITFGFHDGNEEVGITLPTSKLFVRWKSDPNICVLLLAHQELETDETNYDFILGIPFFASTYIEMHWQDTRNINDWNQMNFSALVTITEK